MPLYCLVYTSVANQKLPDELLKELLKKSRQKNDRLNITGMLLYLDPYFIQILEGEEAIVTESFNTIKRDQRHSKVRLVYKQPINSRNFHNWTMGFHKVNDEQLDRVEGFNDFWQHQTSEFFSDSPNETELKLQKLLEMFKDETLF